MAVMPMRCGNLAPRVGVEPTSLILIQSQAGPADRPTGDGLERLLARRRDRFSCPTDQPGMDSKGYWPAGGTGSHARQTNRGWTRKATGPPAGPVLMPDRPTGDGLERLLAL